MLYAIIMKFPVSIIDEQSQTFFLHLVVCLANDRDNKVRSMTGTVIKLLIGRVSPRSLQSILEFSRSWYLGDKPHLWSAAAQMKIIFNCFKSISPKLVDQNRLLTPDGEVDCQSFAYHMLLPLYKVCEGFAGKVISDDVKQMAEEVRGSISKVMGVQSFVQIYSHIRKNLKSKRDKRKQEEKVIAVVNPMRNAKRKLRNAEKHKAHKKRKMMAMKMGRWM
ncbi:uncharacterized protein LOC132056479 isoform X2 [Lycium ferocissimum]|uniref:uncharacterized protein LOC132056479 isoform X2 n=1 Tax=Lycium ferocissimum TaxID=112874 RepID=UPI002814BD9D|nr:uncharacterized protein LOC132056479 isoform X2 [Lycium ferocissimum]